MTSYLKGLRDLTLLFLATMIMVQETGKGLRASRRITSTNFGDKLRTFLFDPEKIECSEIEEGSDGRPYTQMVYTVIEPAADPKEEKLLITSSTRLVIKLARWIFEKRKYLLEIQKTGTGFSTDWEVDRAD